MALPPLDLALSGGTNQTSGGADSSLALGGDFIIEGNKTTGLKKSTKLALLGAAALGVAGFYAMKGRG